MAAADRNERHDDYTTDLRAEQLAHDEHAHLDGPGCVQQELSVELVLSPERSLPVPVLLAYCPQDPFAVHVTFHLGQDSPVTWVFARELLVEGVFRACGTGDVRIWPTRADGRSLICLALSSPAGEALLEAPAAPIAAWLEQTLRVVPTGTESAVMDLDAEIAALLGGE
ncbi:SsgA family sporulation/cell division regulator [Streptacidiphilus melanogenes]|uniref:SsgA family sporulation/cell division regulator n=1 Tax=Streptacidiphilus melanogenes TaxID=411235 RepID=UPI0006939AB3|nr:SsgA family sporulation/cell division regulator [Streptacidiphilus melanogenes]